MTHLHEIAPEQHGAPQVLAAIPALTTERLTLRVPQLQDFPTLVAIDDNVGQTSLRGPRSRKESWRDFAQMTATWIWRGHGWWTVFDDDGPCGFVGIGFEPGDTAPELAYLFAPSSRGKGYATESCLAARDFARDVLKLPALLSYISDTNTASQNVARKLGASRDSTAETALGEDGVQVWRHWNGGA